jgi:calcineurin-like phosphoesterase family protein
MRLPKTWAITDTHWNHDVMIERGYRPADYQERIKRHWLRLVMPEDTIIHLGDVIVGRNSELKDILAPLPGFKILCRGNHDRESDGWYRRAGFAYVANGILVGGVWLTHAPQATLPDGAIINVHGHLHDDDHRGTDFPAHCKLLAIERTDYAPVELSQFVGFTPMARRILMPFESEIIEAR